MTTKTARTQAQRNEFGSYIPVSTGAVRGHSGGDTNLYLCNTCHGDVVWATSKRTGRKYLCNARSAYNGSWFFMGNDLHKCDEVLAQRKAADKVAAQVQADLQAEALKNAYATVQLVEEFGVEINAAQLAAAREYIAQNGE